EIRRDLARPMSERIHRTRRPQRTSMACVSEIHRIEPARNLQELFQLGHGFLFVLATASDRENHVVVAEALGVSKTMQCIRHRRTASAGIFSVITLVMRPRPILVLARSSL